MADNTIGWGQAHINNTISFGGDVSCGGSSYTGLFNEFGSPAFGASVRLLDNTYTDGLVRVRAFNGALDQGTADVLPDPSAGYFISLNSLLVNTDATAQLRGVVDGSTLSDLLANPLGTDYDGYVTTWYDQSGNANDATQATAASQPQIASAGSLLFIGSNPYVEFSGGKWLRTGGAYPTQQYQSSFYVVQDAASNGRLMDTRGTGSVGASQGWFNKPNNSTASEVSVIDNGIGAGILNVIGVTRAAHFLGSSLMYGGGSDSYLRDYTNGVLANETTTPSIIDFNSGNNLMIGANEPSATTQFFSGKAQELIAYNTDKATDRTNIETNINNAFSIYP